MDEKKMQEKYEYLSEDEAKSVKDLFKKYLKKYKEKDPEMSDQEWLSQLFNEELPEVSEEEAEEDAKEIVEGIAEFDNNLKSCNEAVQNGISKEKWLENKIEEASVGISAVEYGRTLETIDSLLYEKNIELADALSRSKDGNIMMSRNLDGNIAENMIANTAEMSAHLQGKNISVDVLESHNLNSVDVRAINHDTGQYQNYQLKFGKDAKATIELIERGNYNNQRIIVPSEQLKEVQAYFKGKGSSKNITDHIDAFGIEGKSFTKEEMKNLQERAQSEGVAPSLDYSHYQTKDLIYNIGKNAGTMALQAAAVTTGFTIAQKVMQGEEIDKDELVEIAIKAGADTSIKTVTAGTLQVAIRKGIIKFIPKSTPAGIIVNIACVGIENVKILAKIASGEISVTKGLDQMGRVTTSMVGGLWGAAKGAAIGAKLGLCVPVIGPGVAVVTGFVGGMVGYFGGSKIGDAIYSTAKKVASGAKTVAKATMNGIKKVATEIGNGIRNIGHALSGLFC